MAHNGSALGQTSAEQAVAAIKSGDTVYVGSAAGTPTVLLAALFKRASQLADVRLLHFITDGLMPADQPAFVSPFVHRTFFVGHEMRELMRRGGQVEYITLSIAQLPRMLALGHFRPDVAMIQVSRPDAHGFVSLGVSVDITHAMVEHAGLVLAESNLQMPRTHGETHVALSRLHALVPTDRPLPEFTHPPADATARQIAGYIESLIDDGSTLQVGVGQLPNEALRFLGRKNHLGIHSDLITDTVLDLVDRGVVTGRAKSTHKGAVVASYCFGTRRLYERIDGNPQFLFQGIDEVCDPLVIAAQHRMVSISQAFSIDLTGQVCADQFGGAFYGGVSTQPDVMRAVAAARGGKPIVCLASTTPDGATSRIRALLPEGEGVTIARSDVHYVVTEFGIAYLYGKCIRERALALIEIAHPRFREPLMAEAKRLGYLPAQQTLQAASAYPVDEERTLALKGGRTLRCRPARASDGDAIKALFYRMSADDVYTRFFRRLSALNFAETQRLCNVNYDTEVAFVAVDGPPEAERVVATASYYLNPSNRRAEVAYMILPDWQGCGLGGALQKLLFDYGKRRGIREFVAEVLRNNTKMVRLAKAACDQVTVTLEEDCYEIVMLP